MIEVMDETPVPRRWSWLVLFASSTTLVCCALPILLVSIGLGAVSASLFASLPFLVTMAQYKAWMFAGSGGVLVLAAWLLFRPGRACPADPVLAEQCDKAHRWNKRFYWVSVGIWVAGFGAAYLALPIYLWLEGG
jgi:hypothetical protein